MSGTDSQAPPRRAALAFIFVTIVLDMLALGMIAPVLPKLVERFVGGDTAHAAEIYGLFGTVWALMQFFFSPVLGALSDRFGRRTVILLSNFGLGLDYILMALAPTLAWLFVGRVISGITAASISNESTVGLTMALFGISSMIVQAGLVGPVVKRFGERRRPADRACLRGR